MVPHLSTANHSCAPAPPIQLHIAEVRPTKTFHTLIKSLSLPHLHGGKSQDAEPEGTVAAASTACPAGALLAAYAEERDTVDGDDSARGA